MVVANAKEASHQASKLHLCFDCCFLSRSLFRVTIGGYCYLTNDDAANWEVQRVEASEVGIAVWQRASFTHRLSGSIKLGTHLQLTDTAAQLRVEQ